jgi:multidrug resistance efflux pump
MSQYRFTATDKVEPSGIVRRVWVFSSIIITILVSILFLPWQQTVKGQGVLTAFDPTERDYSILAPVDGFVEQFYVHENQFVKQGEPLFKMVDLDNNYLLKLQKIEENLKYQVENIKLDVKNLEQQAIETKNYLQNGINVYDQKISQVEDKIQSLELKKVSLEKKFEIEKANFERTESLYKEGIESKRTYDLIENSFIKADAELKQINIDIVVEKKNISIQKREREKFFSQTQNKLYSLDSKLLGVKNKEKKLQQQLFNQSIVIERYQNSEVVAPKDGFVIRLFKNDKNRYIKKGEKVIHFAPEVTEKAILLKVSDFNMPLIKETLPVRIMFYGWPALQVSGWPEIQFGSFGGYVKRVEHISHEQGFYYAYVVEDPEQPWPKGEDLRMGTQATVWVRLSTVPIWYQLWRFMNAIPPKMIHPEQEIIR